MAAGQLRVEEHWLPALRLADQVKGLAEADHLVPLVRLALPAFSIESRANEREGPSAAVREMGPQAHAPQPNSADAARALCALADALASHPALRQQSLITLATSADLVRRLWFSYLRVRAAPLCLV